MSAKLADRISLFFAEQAFRGLNLIRKLKGMGMAKDDKTAEPGKIYSFQVKTIEGQTKSLADYKGSVLLIVNTASLCGFTPQYDALEALQEKYKDKGLKVLGFPANNFGAQEPGSDSEIKDFCRSKFSVSFDLFSKISVKGEDIHPLYRFLTTESGFNGDIPWNFSKFLVDRQGRIAARAGPETDPMSKSFLKKIEELL